MNHKEQKHDTQEIIPIQENTGSSYCDRHRSCQVKSAGHRYGRERWHRPAPLHFIGCTVEADRQTDCSYGRHGSQLRCTLPRTVAFQDYRVGGCWGLAAEFVSRRTHNCRKALGGEYQLYGGGR